ncbi:MAG: site-specific integrase [Alloprevotella sp.]|nr:site-specific integrase [Alloprevotella sp.]
MRKPLLHTKVTVKLRKSEYREEWYLVVESYPIRKPDGGKPGRIIESVNRIITTPIWDTTAITGIDADGNYKYKPKRDTNGIIQCTSRLDREACIYADKVRALRQQEYDTAVVYSYREQEMIAQNERMEQDFIAYFNSIIYKVHPNSSNSIIVNWTRVGKLLSIFSEGKPIPFRKINVKLLEDLKLFMLTAPQGGNKKGTLSQNSAATYFSIVKAGLHRAFIDEYLTVDIAAKVKGIPELKVKRETLTLEEAELLAQTPCENEVLKRAFFFAILTGIRLCDIHELTWGEIQKTSTGWRVDFTQRKTHVVDYLPINEQAYSLCGEPGEHDQQIFAGLTGSSWISRPLKKWIAASGIKKHITFHCSRHTFATLQLENGTDIFVVKGMLGHTNVKTTQIYAHIVDKSKRNAAEVLQIDGLNT